MKKITKKALMEKALKKYTETEISEAILCEVKVYTKDNNRLQLNLPLTNRGKKSKSDKIRTWIRSFLLNRADFDDRRFFWDTSSENIKSINIKLIYKK